jgi:hypothetical protein
VALISSTTQIRALYTRLRCNLELTIIEELSFLKTKSEILRYNLTVQSIIFHFNGQLNPNSNNAFALEIII